MVWLVTVSNTIIDAQTPQLDGSIKVELLQVLLKEITSVLDSQLKETTP
jgi:hypothetical protein